MNERVLIDGPAGQIEVLVDAAGNDAGGTTRGVALVGHPHPLYGGTPDNKVAQTLARAFVELGYAALRPAFRGIGASQGEHDHGEGETEDMLAVLDWAAVRFGETPPALAGFSFGAFVQTRVAQALTLQQRAPERLVLVGLASGEVTGARSYQPPAVPADTILIHGELDETVPLANVLGWARPQDLPVVVIPGADHFFHRRLHLIRDIIQRAWH